MGMRRRRRARARASKEKEVSLVKEEDVVRRVKHSSFNPDIVAKKWDEKPDMKSIGRSNTWDGSKSSNLLDELKKGQEIRSWSGDRSALEKGGGEVRKRSAEEDQDAEMDRGKTKKVKKYREEGEAYRGGRNPFQAAQNMSNRGEKFERGREERRSWDEKRGGEGDRKYSNGGDRSWSRGGGERNSWGGGGGGGGHRNGGHQHYSKDGGHHNKGNHHRYNGGGDRRDQYRGGYNNRY